MCLRLPPFTEALHPSSYAGQIFIPASQLYFKISSKETTTT